MSKRVVVGLSGGVDSSVAAYLLKEQGYDVIGIFMKNWHDDSVTISDECPWLEDSNDALLVAEKLGIPFQTVDLSVQYKDRIVDYMFKEYENGRTPNPDVLCNREIKFDVFLDIALQLNADYVATGHYCQRDVIVQDNKEVYRLLAGVDENKDQSYFLCQLSQFQLSKALFPIGELTKPQVREIAAKLDLITAEKKDSQGLCFIGKVRLPEFLQQQLKPKEGRIFEIEASHSVFKRVIPIFDSLEEQLQWESEPFVYQSSMGIDKASHQGAHYYTIGQRKGLNVGGTKEPLFIIGIDIQENTIYTGQGADHPGLFRKTLKINPHEMHWVREDMKLSSGDAMEVMVRIRYRQPLQKAKVYNFESGTYIQFDQPQSAITPGQFAACYLADELIGSGVIAT